MHHSSRTAAVPAVLADMLLPGTDPVPRHALCGRRDARAVRGVPADAVIVPPARANVVRVVVRERAEPADGAPRDVAAADDEQEQDQVPAEDQGAADDGGEREQRGVHARVALSAREAGGCPELHQERGLVVDDAVGAG